MIDKVLQQLIDFLQSASPLVWKTLIKQVYVDATTYIIWAVGFTIVCFLLIKLGNHCRAQADNAVHWIAKDNWGIGTALSYVGSVLGLFIAFGLLVSAITHFINPEFYAIRYILSQISGR